MPLLPSLVANTRSTWAAENSQPVISKLYEDTCVGMKEEGMPETRRVRQVLKSRATIEGAGVHLHRAIGFGPPAQYDPFLLLDDFRSDDPNAYVHGFPWHAH